MRFLGIRWLSEAAYKIALLGGILSLSLMFVFLLAGVICRYVIHYPLAWPEETSMILLVWMSFFGASIGLKERSHVGMVALLVLFPAKARSAVIIALDALAGFFGSYLMIFGWKISVFVGTGQRTVYWGIPYFYLYLSVSVGGLLLLIQASTLIMEDLQSFLKPENA